MNSAPFILNLREESAPYFARLELSRQTPVTHSPMDVVITHQSAHERAEAECFIRAIYADAYGAALDIRYPTLMSIADEKGIAAAMGLRDAGSGPLFLEHYLDKPVQEAIYDMTGVPVARHEIIEVGNLGSRGLGAAKYLYLAFHAYACARGYRYVAVTATKALGRSFAHMGIATHLLAHARADRVPGKGAGWGSYYESQPQVMAGSIGQGLEMLMERYGGTYTPLTVALHTMGCSGHA